MELERLAWWCRENRRYLEAKAAAMRAAMEEPGR
jgi:hypothetical protein